MVTLRNTYSGTNSTVLSPDVFGDPMLIALGNIANESWDEADDLAPLVTVLELFRPAWHRDAECRNHPDVDFHSRGTAIRAAAFTICGTRCSVRTDCLSWAIEIEDWTPAILGGTDGPARRRLARNQQTRGDTNARTP